VVFAAFSLAEFASDLLVGWFPLYWLAKCALLVYLYLPATMGAQRLYAAYLRPLLLRYEGLVDAKLQAASDRTHGFTPFPPSCTRFNSCISELLADEAKRRAAH